MHTVNMHRKFGEVWRCFCDMRAQYAVTILRIPAGEGQRKYSGIARIWFPSFSLSPIFPFIATCLFSYSP